LAENALERIDGDIFARLACHCHAARLPGVLELAMTACLTDLIPAIVAEQGENVELSGALDDPP
jgi:hypothetical protein